MSPLTRYFLIFETKSYVVSRFIVVGIINDCVIVQAYDDPSEIGFLGLAFHPDYAQNGYIYAKYTPQANLDFISRFTKSPEGDFIDPASEVVILSLAKEDIMHHGGAPIFGRDRMLWIATGV
jgi:hypothetical protein